jgi:hypothetical protein
MTRGERGSFTTYTASGRGTYRSRTKADSAARWVAGTTGEAVSVVNDRSGESWEVPAPGREAT